MWLSARHRKGTRKREITEESLFIFTGKGTNIQKESWSVLWLSWYIRYRLYRVLVFSFLKLKCPVTSSYMSLFCHVLCCNKRKVMYYRLIFRQSYDKYHICDSSHDSNRIKRWICLSPFASIHVFLWTKVPSQSPRGSTAGFTGLNPRWRDKNVTVRDLFWENWVTAQNRICGRFKYRTEWR